MTKPVYKEHPLKMPSMNGTVSCTGCGRTIGRGEGQSFYKFVDGEPVGPAMCYACARTAEVSDKLDALAHLAEDAGWNCSERTVTEFVREQFAEIKRLRYVANCAATMLWENNHGDCDTTELAIDAMAAALERLDAPPSGERED